MVAKVKRPYFPGKWLEHKGKRYKFSYTTRRAPSKLSLYDKAGYDVVVVHSCGLSRSQVSRGFYRRGCYHIYFYDRREDLGKMKCCR